MFLDLYLCYFLVCMWTNFCCLLSRVSGCANSPVHYSSVPPPVPFSPVQGIYQESFPGPLYDHVQGIYQKSPPVGPLYSGRLKEYTRNPNLVLLSQAQGIYQESFPEPLYSGSRNILGIPTWSSYLRFKEYTRNPSLILFTQVQGSY